jgi:hypothetical protein
MIQPREGASFAGETFNPRRIFSETRRQKLQGTETIEVRLAHFKDSAHPARAEEFDDLQGRKGSAKLLQFRFRNHRPGTFVLGHLANQAKRTKPARRTFEDRPPTFGAIVWG